MVNPWLTNCDLEGQVAFDWTLPLLAGAKDVPSYDGAVVELGHRDGDGRYQNGWFARSE
jgi:hypothetical protein